jgi:hypothetical protein
LNGKELGVTATGYTVNGSVTFTGVDTDSTFIATAKAADYYTDIKIPVVVTTEAVTMDFHYSGKGASFGKVAEEENLLDIAWAIKSPSVDNLLGGYGIAIPSGADLHTTAYVNAGTYVCSSSAIGQSLKNTPTASSFKMTVTNLLSKSAVPDTQGDEYIVREITNIYGYKYYQYVIYSADKWSFGTWYAVLDNYRVKDYVIEQGTYDDGWEYVKWNSGKIELWVNKSLSFPKTIQVDTYLWRTIASVDMQYKLKEIVGGNCPIQHQGVVPQLCRNSATHTTADIVIATSRTFEAFTLTVPIYIIGKWK